MAHEFTAWPKTPRLFRDIVVTEKIDGTNAAVHFEDDGTVTAQSRKRIITPQDDNFGFARWAHGNAAELFELLGPGLHFGEWWGAGVQRGYNQNGKNFSLFNTAKHGDVDAAIGDVFVRAVPVLYEGPFSEAEIVNVMLDLRKYGSYAAPEYTNPEGICVYHTQTRGVFKVTLDNNDAGKWEQ